MIIKGRAIVIAGQPGSPNILTIGTITTLSPGSSATASITGTSPNQVLNLGIPAGSTGNPGAANTLSIGTITTLPAGSSATATITGTAPNQTLNLGIPAGNTGSAGPANVLSIGSITTLAPGASATATITGTAPNQTLSLGIPAGATGSVNTLTIGTVTTLAAGSSATATITGTAPNQTLNLGIPTGATGTGLSPGTAISTAVTLGTAFRATDTTKPHFLSVMIDVAYSITVAAALADVVELWVGPVSADVASGNTATARRVASFRSSLTGIALSIGMGSGDRGQLTWLVPPGHYCAVRRTTGTTATIAEAFMQPMT